MKNNTLFGFLCSNSLPSAAYKNTFAEKITVNAKSIHKRWLLMPLMAMVFLFTNVNAWGQVVQTYTTAGSYTWRCPADVTSVTVECWGGGGGGGGAAIPGSLNHTRGGGGAGGGYVKRTSYTVTPGTLYTVYVGNGGSAGSTSGGAGGSGEASYFIDFNTISATGGNGGGGGTASNGTHNGAGGTKKSSGNVGADVGASFYGGSGASATGVFNNNSNTGNSGASGASAGTGADGGNASGITAGAVVTGGVAGVAGRNSVNPGSTGNSGGGGGSGAYRYNTTTGSSSGGAGGAGKVVLTYSYCASAAVSVGQGTWPNSQNDNTSGLGAWSLSSGGGGGHFAAGSGSGNDILNGGTNAWGMFANGTNPASNFSNATRTVTMNVGNVLSFSMDNMGVNTNSSVGIGLQNSSGNNIMEFYFRGGQSNYEIADNAGSNISTGVPYTTNGLDITITYVSATTYDISITPRNGSTTTMSGRTFSNPSGGRVPGIIRFFNAGAGGSGVNVYFNSLTISRPIITAHPSTSSQSTCTGSGTNLSVTATGASSYQWFSATDAAGSTGVTNLGSNNGAQTATYTPTSGSAGTLYYYCIVTGSCGSTARSNVSGAVTFNAPAVGGTASATSTSLCLNSSTGLSLTGHTGTIQWQRSEDNSSWSNTSGATSTSYTTPNLIVTTYYRAALTNGTCTANSNVLTLTVPSAGNVSNASLSTYNSSWSNSQNDNTTGFGAWTLSTSGTAGFFTGSSDINNGGSRSWALFANNGSVANAVRTASISIGNTISFSMDNNWIDNSYSVGFNLQNASGENLMGFYFTGDGSNYMISDNAGANSSGVGYTAGGLDVSISYTGVNTYAIHITGKGGSTVSLIGRTFTTQSGGQVPAQIRFYNGGAGSGANYDLFFNSLSISNPVITAHPSTSTQTVCQNASATALSVTATGATSYQWFSATNAAGTTGVTNLGSGTGAQTNSYTPSTASAGTLYYFCEVTNSSCGTLTSNVSGAVTVTAAPASAGSNGTLVLCSGTTLTTTLLYNALTGLPAAGGTWSPAIPTSGSVAGTYTYTQTAISPCAVNNSATVVVTDSPTSTWSAGAWSNTPITSSTSLIISDTFTSTEDITACSLRITNGSTVVIFDGHKVTLSGPIISETSSSFVTFNNNSILLQTGSGYVNTGNINYKKASSPIFRLDYTLWSSPLTDANQPIFSFSNQTLTNRFYTYNEATNFYTTNDMYISGTPAALNASSSFQIGRGYLIRSPNNWVSNPGTAAAWTGTFTGVPNNGDIAVPIFKSGAVNGYNAVGNPYPSPISIDSFLSDNSTVIGSTLWFWRKTNGVSGSAYITYSGTTFSSGPSNSLVALPDQPADVIQPGQGFFVRATSSGSLQFKNTQRVGTNGSFFRNNSQTTAAGEGRLWLNLKSNAIVVGNMALGYKEGATNDLDVVYDGEYINDSPLALTSSLPGKELSVQHRAAPFVDTDVVPLSFKTDVAGTYSIDFNGTDGVLDTQDIYLEDLLLGQSVAIKTTPYTFTSEAGTFSNRFRIVYVNNSLGTNAPVFNANQVVIYKNEINDFVVNAGNVIMSNIKVFDIRGRLLQEYKDINTSQTTINVGMTNEVLLVQITSEDGVVVTKKVVR